MKIRTLIFFFLGMFGSLTLEAQPIHTKARLSSSVCDSTVSIYYQSIADPYTYLIGAYYTTDSIYTYRWFIDNVELAETDSVFNYPFSSEGLYALRVIVTSNSATCIDTIDKVINVTNAIEVPTVFTPNGDNVNDKFTVQSNGRYFLSLKVFTRTGVLIYKTVAKTISWDGYLISGDIVSPGIYFYTIETLGATSPQIPKKGFLYIFQ